MAAATSSSTSDRYWACVTHETFTKVKLPTTDAARDKKLNELVKGYIEAIIVPEWTTSLVLIANEEGVCNNMELNGTAPILAETFGCNVIPFCHYENPGYLRGPIVFARYDHTSGEFAGFTLDEVDALKVAFDIIHNGGDDDDELMSTIVIPESLQKVVSKKRPHTSITSK